MSKANSTKKTNATKSDLQLVLEKIFQHWRAHQHTFRDGRPRRAFAENFKIELKTFTRWLNGEHVPQGDLWDGFIHQLRTKKKKTDVQGKTTDQNESLFDESWVQEAERARESAAEAEKAKKQPRNPTAPDASSTDQSAPAPAPSALRFRAEQPQTVKPNPDQWFQLILHDAPQDAPNQLSFTIDYLPQPITPPGGGNAPLLFQVSLPEVRIVPGWGAVTALKDSINVKDANPTVTYARGWKVILPQNANGFVLDHFEAALLQARAAGDRLLLSAYARREDIAITRISGCPPSVNRDAVIAQALRMLGFEGEATQAEIAAGAIVAEQEDKT